MGIETTLDVCEYSRRFLPPEYISYNVFIANKIERWPDILSRCARPYLLKVHVYVTSSFCSRRLAVFSFCLQNGNLIFISEREIFRKHYTKNRVKYKLAI